MARINYSSYLKKESTQKTDSKDYKVSFFNLKEDGEEAVVRFAYESTEDFHIATVHVIEVEGKPRRVGCLRTGVESLSKCPLCESEDRVYDKMYVKVIQYTTDAEGHVVHQAKVWERPAYFSKTLENCFKEYGPLADVIFKIKRRGKKGDTKTTYDILFANPAVYKSDIYTKDFSDFKDFEINKFFYTDRTADEMRVFLDTGSFPEKQKSATDKIAPSVPTSASTPVFTPVSTPVITPVITPIYITPVTTTTVRPVEQAVSSTPTVPAQTTPTKQGDVDPTAQRPRRYTY